MASVSSVSSGSSIYGSRSSNIISGLASGMDTESMIEGMVQGIKSKIDKQKQAQTKLQWQQTAYRSISDQLVQLSSKYTSYSSDTNLMSSDFFSPSIITSLGKYADKISASGSTTSDIKIKDATMGTTETITFNGLNGITSSGKESIEGTSSVDLKGKDFVSNLAGKNIDFKYGNSTFSITFPEDGQYKSVQDVADAINEQLKQAKVQGSSGSITMSDKIQATVKDGKLEISMKNADDGNTLEITSTSSSEALSALGLAIGNKIDDKNKTITSSKEVTAEMLYTEKNISDVLAGASMNINFNGKTATIKFPEKDSAEYKAIFEASSSEEAATKMEEYLQKQIDNAFGYGRIDVKNGAEGGKFTPKFELTKDNKDAVFSITSGSLGVVGEDSIFGIGYNTSNRTNTSATLEKLGIKFDNLEVAKGVGTPKLQDDGKTYKDDNGNLVDADGNRIDEKGNKLYAFEINGVKVGEYSKDTTLSKIISDINNNKEVGVSVKYSQTADQFVFTATNGGSGGRVAISDDNNLAANIFGTVTYESNGVKFDDSRITRVEGKDATMTAVINGQEKKLTSDSNTFNIDGFAVTVNGDFPEAGTQISPSDYVSFNKSVDADKVVDTLKKFVEEYNKMLDDLGTAYTTQPNNKYSPLTDDQKADMTEKQIEEYEKKAKEGILFADSDLQSLAGDLRFLFSSNDLSDIGITTSTDASERGKLKLDEKTLRSAIASDPEKVQKAFVGTTDSDGQSLNDGAMPKLKEVLDKYAATTGATKGILIEKAGSQYSPVALLNNTIKTQIDDLDDVIDKLNDQLNDKIDFYTSKFSKLEVLISQMNSQSSYLSGMMGSGS